jgi:hypothetical protein
MKRIAIVQSNYIPWKGYFDLIRWVDEFILLDNAQYTRRDWRNRNRIKTPQGTKWLTIPVQVRGRYHQRIDETRIDDPGWAESHWKTLQQFYRPSACFDEMAPRFEKLYASVDSDRLSEINRRFLGEICAILGIQTRLSWSTDYGAEGARGEQILDLCLKAGAEVYLSGPSARDYLDEAAFEAAGVRVEWFDYSGYPQYPQLHPPFVHEVSIVDLIFNTGTEASNYMKPL